MPTHTRPYTGLNSPAHTHWSTLKHTFPLLPSPKQPAERRPTCIPFPFHPLQSLGTLFWHSYRQQYKVEFALVQSVYGSLFNHSQRKKCKLNSPLVVFKALKAMLAYRTEGNSNPFLWHAKPFRPLPCLFMQEEMQIKSLLLAFLWLKILLTSCTAVPWDLMFVALYLLYMEKSKPSAFQQ